ncbi:hypothetical protein GCM10027168_56010 [Streptomyces capparidis]
MSHTAAQVRALFAGVVSTPAAAPPPTRRTASLPGVPVNNLELSREEAAAALFEVYTDEYGLPGISTDTLHDVLGAAVFELGPVGLLEATETFSGLDGTEFPEVADCRWFAYRLSLARWHTRARTRPMTLGEATAALYLSDHARTATTPRAGGDPRAIGRMVRQGAARVPTPALLRLGRAVTADLARMPDPTHGGAWLSRTLLSDHGRTRRCFELLRGNPRIPLPTIVRPDRGGHLVGAVPPPGPGNHWARPLREEW